MVMQPNQIIRIKKYNLTVSMVVDIVFMMMGCVVEGGNLYATQKRNTQLHNS